MPGIDTDGRQDDDRQRMTGQEDDDEKMRKNGG